MVAARDHAAVQQRNTQQMSWRVGQAAAAEHNGATLWRYGTQEEGCANHSFIHSHMKQHHTA
jgi:hypothetical protein